MNFTESLLSARRGRLRRVNLFFFFSVNISHTLGARGLGDPVKLLWLPFLESFAAPKVLKVHSLGGPRTHHMMLGCLDREGMSTPSPLPPPPTPSRPAALTLSLLLKFTRTVFIT